MATARAAGATYGALFAALLAERALLALGLYRRRVDRHGAPVEFVLTSPPADTPLLDADRVYVIGAATTASA